MKENNPKRQRNIRVLLVIFLIIVIIVSYKIIEKKLEEKSEKEKIKTYSILVEEFLNQKYNRQFEIEFYKKGYGANYWDFSETFFDCDFYCGHNENIEEYIFKYYPKDNKDIIGCIGVRYNIEKEETETVELEHGYDKMYFFDEYTTNIMYHYKKREIKEMLNGILNSDYLMDLETNSRKIQIETDINLENMIDENPEACKRLLKDIMKVIKDVDKTSEYDVKVDIIVKYEDTDIELPEYCENISDTINGELTFSNIISREIIIEKIAPILKNTEYIYGFNNDGRIIIEKNNEYNKDIDEPIIEKIRQWCIDEDYNCNIKFLNYSIFIGNNGSRIDE